MSIPINLHAINLDINTNYSYYHDYLKLHFNKVLLKSNSPKTQIKVDIQWRKEALGFLDNKNSEKIAANTFLGKDQVCTTRKISKRKKVMFLFNLKDNIMTVKAQTRFKAFKDTLRYKIFKKPQEGFFFELTYPLIYYPLFWYLERFHDTYPIHAGALDMGGKGVVVCGLEGTGKTTLSLLLAKKLGARFLSDNLTFYDNQSIYPCYEPVRIHKNESDLLWKDNFSKINKFKTLKDFYEPTEVNKEGVVPRLFIFPIFSKEFSIDKISQDRCVSKILNLNQLTQELGNYTEYASLFNLLDPQSDIFQKRQKTLSNILSNANCYQLRMRKDDGVEANLERVKQFVVKELS